MLARFLFFRKLFNTSVEQIKKLLTNEIIYVIINLTKNIKNLIFAKENIMENSVKTKINTFGKVFRIITTVFIVCLYVIEGFLLLGTVLSAVFPKDAVVLDVSAGVDVKINNSYFDIDNGKFSAVVGDGKLSLGSFDSDEVKVKADNGSLLVNADFSDRHFDLSDIMIIFICAIISVAAVIVALYFFRALMKRFEKCETPFEDEIIKKMRAFAIALIPTLAVSMIAKSMIGNVFSYAFIGDTSISIDMLPVAFVVVVFVLTAIFRYGAQLQKEHDETV